MYGKLIIKCKIKVLTGLHIGGSSAFSAIGAVDSPVIKDPLTCRPIIPGSSLKGKLRSLLARSLRKNDKEKDFEADPPEVKRLFGCASPAEPARLQFADCFVCAESVLEFEEIGLTEVKYENTINRLTAEANPRQIERVNRGVCFDCRIAYTLENENEAQKDLENLAHAMKLLQLDYLGGHGTRGSGRVCFEDIELVDAENIISPDEMELFRPPFEEVKSDGLLPV